jgi:type II secretion system protein N
MNLRRLHNQSPYAWPVGWMLYTLMMVAIFLAVTFPYEALHAMFLLRLSERTGMEIHTEEWGVRWPAGIIWAHPSIRVAGLQPIEAEQLQVNVKLSSLLRGQPVLVWSGHIGGHSGPNGPIKGELSLASWSWNGSAQILGSVEQLDLSQLEFPLVKRGVLRGRFERRWTHLSSAGRSLLEEATWHVELSELALEHLPIGPRSISSLTLSSLSGRLECHSATCRIESLRGETQEGMLSGEGELVWHDSLSTSHLALTLSVIMTEALKERLHLMSLGPSTPGLPHKITLSGPLSDLHVSL